VDLLREFPRVIFRIFAFCLAVALDLSPPQSFDVFFVRTTPIPLGNVSASHTKRILIVFPLPLFATKGPVRSFEILFL